MLEAVNLQVVTQCWIVFWSLQAAWFTTSKQQKQRWWGFICGLVSQPGWFYAVITADQWGQFVMACVYTAMWIRGILNNRRDRNAISDKGKAG